MADGTGNEEISICIGDESGEKIEAEAKLSIPDVPEFGDFPDRKIAAPPEVIGDVKGIEEAKFGTKRDRTRPYEGGESSTQPQAQTHDEMMETFRGKYFSNRWFKSTTMEGYTNYFQNVAAAFDQREVRNKFVQRVFIILAIHLVVCIIFNFVALNVNEVHKFFDDKTNCYLVFVASGVFLACYFLLSCISALGRCFPINLLVLIITTGCLAYVSAFIAIHFETHIFLISMIATFIIYVHIVVFSSNPKFDIAHCTSVLTLFIIFFLLFALLMTVVALLITNTELMNLSYAIVVTVTFTMLLVYDMKKIMDGYRIDLDTNDYLYAVLSLYLNAAYAAMWLVLKCQTKRKQ